MGTSAAKTTSVADTHNIIAARKKAIRGAAKFIRSNFFSFRVPITVRSAEADERYKY